MARAMAHDLTRRSHGQPQVEHAQRPPPTVSQTPPTHVPSGGSQQRRPPTAHVHAPVQKFPSLSRLQVCDSGVIDAGLHVPLPHVYSVRVRDCVPLSSHDELKPEHALHALYVGEPHAAPAVERAHACDSSLETDEHVPPEQTGSVRVRVCVPLSSHSSLNTHALQPLNVVPPQPVPSVSREHDPDSTRSDEMHVPPMQS
jgi:hypothetical protein